MGTQTNQKGQINT